MSKLWPACTELVLSNVQKWSAGVMMDDPVIQILLTSPMTFEYLYLYLLYICHFQFPPPCYVSHIPLPEVFDFFSNMKKYVKKISEIWKVSLEHLEKCVDALISFHVIHFAFNLKCVQATKCWNTSSWQSNHWMTSVYLLWNVPTVWAMGKWRLHTLWAVQSRMVWYLPQHVYATQTHL